MSKQLNKKLFSLVNGQPVSSRDVLSLIYKDLESTGKLKDFPALCFARHLQNHPEITRDPFAYDALIQMITIFVNNLWNHTLSHYGQLTNSALPLFDIGADLNKFCQKKILKQLNNQGFSIFITDFLNSFDDKTLVAFDPKNKLYKNKNVEQALTNLFNSQPSTQPWQITKLNSLVISRDQFWGEGESIIIGVDVNILELPKFDGTIIREIDNLTFQYELIRIN